MGGGFSVPTLKVKLNVATKRIDGQMNKKNNQIKVQRKEIAQLLADKKDETARIRVEALWHLQNMVSALELLKLMLELLLNRVTLIASERTCPPDLLECTASIIYSARRVEVPELEEIGMQLASKFGEEWAKTHVQNQSQQVNPRIVEKLAVTPPPFKTVVDILADIAKTYNVDWEPTLHSSEEKENHQGMGSVLALSPQEKRALDPDMPPPVSIRPAGKPGTLTLSIHEARRLYLAEMFGKQDPYVKISVPGTKASYKTAVDKNAKDHAIFREESFAFIVKDGDRSVLFEVFNKNRISDDFIGRALIDVDFLIEHPGQRWFPLTRGPKYTDDAGEISITAQYSALSVQPVGDEVKFDGHPPQIIAVNPQQQPVGQPVGAPVFQPVGQPMYVPSNYGPYSPPGYAAPMQNGFISPQGYPPQAAPAPQSPETAPGQNDGLYDLPSVPQKPQPQQQPDDEEPQQPKGALDSPQPGAGDEGYDDLEARFRALQGR